VQEMLTSIVNQYIKFVSAPSEKLLCTDSDAFQRVQVHLEDLYLSSLFAIGQELFGNLVALLNVPAGNINIGACESNGLCCFRPQAPGRATGNENYSAFLTWVLVLALEVFLVLLDSKLTYQPTLGFQRGPGPLRS
jgi:hypothetical protein